MDLVVIPQALLIAYGFLVLASGAGLGVVLGRNLPRRLDDPQPPERLERRIRVLEEELDAAQAELAQLSEQADFVRRLSAPRTDDGSDRGRFVA